MIERPRKILTLCMIVEDGHVLLGMKKRGFGAGWWNGFGGKLMEGESLEDAARREVFEETGLTVEEMEKAGEIEFEFVGQDEILHVHVFRATEFSGEAQESDEMRPQWFAFADIPYTQMWPSDGAWLPTFLEGKKFRGKIFFDENTKPVGNEIEVYG